MPSTKSEITEISSRIIALSDLYPTNKEFLQQCRISNHSLITDLKKGRIKNPGADILALIVRGTGCNGTWLLTGEGEMFSVPQSASNAGGKRTVLIKSALNLINKIEPGSNGLLDEINMPENIEVRLAELLAKILKSRPNSAT